MLRPMWEASSFSRPYCTVCINLRAKTGGNRSQGWRRDNKKPKKGIDLVWVGRNVYLWDPSFICTR